VTDLFGQLRRYTGFDEEAAARVRRVAPIVRRHIPRIVEVFHAEIERHGEARGVFADDAQFDRHHRNLAQWLEELVGGAYDDAYFDSHTLAGRAHNLVRLPQRFMFGAMAVVRAAIVQILADEEVPDAFATATAFGRLLDLELAVMLESYAENRLRVEVESARASTFQEALSLETSLRVVEEQLNELVADETALVSVVMTLSEATDCGVVAVHRYDATTGHLWLTAHHGLDAPITAAIADLDGAAPPISSVIAGAIGDWDAAELSFADAMRAAGLDGLTVFPVRSGAEVLGTLSFGVCAGRRLGEVERGILQSVADHLGTALRLRTLLAREADSRRFETLARFSRVLAHEVRNPLNSMSLQAAILRRRIAAFPEESRHALERPLAAFEQETRRLNELVEHYLLIGKSGDLRRERVRLIDLVDNVLQVHEPATAEADIEVLVDRSQLDLVVDVDFAKIAQVLHNLVRNCIEAMPTGGQIELRARATDHAVHLSVRDTGPGVSKPEQIFEMFFTTKPLGTGLGLPVAREIARAHGGDLEYVPGRGGEFVVTLPLAS
jgi:signal transduction histidine kinase